MDIALPHHVVRGLANAVEDAFLRVSNKRDILQYHLQEFDGIYASLTLTLDRVLRDLATRHRASNPTACDRMPFDIMPEICQYLSIEDTTSTSQVCRAWRTACLDCARVWTRPHISTVTEGTWNAPVRKCNIRFFRHILGRSAQLPLALNVTAHNSPIPDSFLSDFVSTLAPHRSRLVSLRLDCRDDLLLTNMCPFFEQLDSLKTLILAGSGGDWWGLRFPPKSMALPVLEELVLHIDVMWSSDTSVSFPSLRKLTLALREDEDLIAMVAACPALQRLHITAHYELMFYADHAFERLNYIPVVVMDNNEVENHFLRSIIHARRLFLELRWFKEQTCCYDALNSINGHFDSYSVVLTFGKYDRLHVWCIDQQGTERLLTYWETLPGPEDEFEIWQYLSPRSLLAITLQPCLWRCATRALPEVHALTTLGFLLAQPEDVDAISCAPWREHRSTTIFVSLTTLHLRAYECLRPVRLSAAEVSRVIRALDLGRPLPSLVLHGVIVDDIAAIEGVTTTTSSADLSLPFTPPTDVPEDA